MVATLARADELKGHAAMLAFSAFVAGSFSLGTRIANDIDPTALTAVRFLMASIFLGAVALATGVRLRPHLSAPWRHALLGGLYALYFVLMFEGLKTAPPVSAAAVFTLTPLMAAGFGFWIMGQVTTPRMGVALLIGAVGALWVIFRGDLAALLAFQIGRGEVIYFFGCIAHALYIPLVPKLGRGAPVMALSFGVLVAGAVLLGAAGAGRIASTDWSSLPPRVWWTLIYISIFATVVSVSLVQFASLRLKAAKVMAYTYLIPSWVILWELALTGTVPGMALLPGVGLTAAALLVLLYEGRSPPASPNSLARKASNASRSTASN